LPLTGNVGKRQRSKQSVLPLLAAQYSAKHFSRSGTGVSAPCHDLIRPDQREISLVEVARYGQVQRNYLEFYAAP
jgi:hypothetical protein